MPLASLQKLIVNVFFIHQQRKIEIEHIQRLKKNKQLMIFDSSIVIEVTEKSQCEEKTITFNSFENRDEAFDCI